MVRDDKFFKDMSLERLPTSVHTILATASEDLDVSKLVSMVDHIVETARRRISAIDLFGSTLAAQLPQMAQRLVETELNELANDIASTQKQSASPISCSQPKSSIPVFVVADISCAILCADFLAAFDLLVDFRYFFLHDKTTNLAVRNISSSDASRQLSVLDPGPEDPFRQLPTKYPASLIPTSESLFHRTTLFTISGPLILARFLCHAVLLLHFVRMLFGLRNASHASQKFADRALRAIPFVHAYSNDLLIEHMENLTTAFDRLLKFDFVLNPSKNIFGVPSLEFLGYLVDSNGILRFPSKVATVGDFPPPPSKCDLQRFPVIIIFYHWLLPQCADTTLPLKSLLSGPKHLLESLADALAAFDKVKVTIAQVTLLTHSAPDALIPLMVDASNVAVGAVLQQHFAVHLRQAQSPEIRQLNYISQFISDIRYIDGLRNEVASALSRPTITHLQLSPGIDLAEMTVEQRRLGFPCDKNVSGLQLWDLPLTTGCTRIRTRDYHLATSGIVEWLHGRLKAFLRDASDHDNWTDQLLLALLGVRFSLESDLDCSTAELVFRVTVRLSGEMISPTCRGVIEDLASLQHRLRHFMRRLSRFRPGHPSPSLTSRKTWRHALTSISDVIGFTGS
ncbi:hypothetical protein SprV_0301125800 [Sparganum proliferum]